MHQTPTALIVGSIRRRYLAPLAILACLTVLIAPFGYAYEEASELPFAQPSASEVLKLQSATLATSRGNIIFELYPEVAPRHVANLKFLSERKFFSGKRIDKVLPSHLVQFGTPTSREAAEYSYSIAPEFSARRHEFGTLGMARDVRPRNSSRRWSSATRLHILLTENARMDGDFTAIGKVIHGAEILKALRAGDEIRSFTVFVAAS